MNKNKYNTLIIGGSSSFGYSTAEKLAEAKHNLLLSYFKEQEAAKMKNFVKWLKDNFDIQVFAKKLDIRKETQIKNYIESAPFPIHNLVYSVSMPIKHVPIVKETWDAYQNHWELQVGGLWRAINILSNKNHPLRRIVAIGTIWTLGSPSSGISSYITAKYALSGFIKTAAIELARHGITVNMISPGASGKGVSRSFPDVMLDLIKKQTPLKRIVSPKDVASLIEFLLGEDAGYITGLNIPLAGGLHI